MLYTYHYPENHTIEKLNQFLMHFLDNLKTVKSNSKFTDNFFDNEFLLYVNRAEELKKKFKSFFNSFKKISQTNKDKFHDIVSNSKNIESFFSDISLDCTELHSNNLNDILGNASFSELITHLFKNTLKNFDIKGHYSLIYEKMDHKICPFCGIESMHNSFREDYDHLAAKSIYPILGINPKNLAPMCDVCNSKNKKNKDIFYDKLGKRRLFPNPYKEKINITLDYKNSIIPQTEMSNQTGKWLIEILPVNDTTKNWDDIFRIRYRYVTDFLEPNFEDWLNSFIKDCIWAGKDLTKKSVIKQEFSGMSTRLADVWYKDHNIIKSPLFDYLSKCDNDIFYNSIIERFNRMKSNNLVA